MPGKKATPPARPMVLAQVQQEVTQGHLTRRDSYRSLEEQFGPGKKVVALFTSFFWPVILQDADADMLEEVLRNTLTDGEHLVLVLNSPGGEALAAERIVNICRSYSRDGFTVIVPKMAKSAATMVCLGANETKGRVEPFLQQLNRFDARDIRWIVSAQGLPESIAVRSLQSGAMKGQTQGYIKNKIKPLLDPVYAKVHGRPLYPEAVTKCGLPVKLQDIRSKLWQTVWQLYIRLDNLIGTPNLMTSKIIESANDSYQASFTVRGEQP